MIIYLLHNFSLIQNKVRSNLCPMDKDALECLYLYFLAEYRAYKMINLIKQLCINPITRER